MTWPAGDDQHPLPDPEVDLYDRQFVRARRLRRTDLGPGLGARGRPGNNTFDSINLYDDLNSTNNLYAYKWTSGRSTTIANAAVGTVNSGQWYELTAKVNGPSISVYLNNNLELQGSDSALQPGSIALYGEGGVEQFANVFVRQYAAHRPDRDGVAGGGWHTPVDQLYLHPPHQC